MFEIRTNDFWNLAFDWSASSLLARLSEAETGVDLIPIFEQPLRRVRVVLRAKRTASKLLALQS